MEMKRDRKRYIEREKESERERDREYLGTHCMTPRMCDITPSHV